MNGNTRLGWEKSGRYSNSGSPYGKQRLYVRDLPLHHSQKEAEITDTYSVFEYHIKPTLDFEQEILSRGTDMEVLAPLWLRENIAETIHKMSLKYPND